jgi:subfamily B ATP-binding cassette protein MsbA
LVILRDLKFLAILFKPYVLFLILGLIGGLIESGALAGLAFILKNVVDDIFVNKDFQSLKWIVGVIIAIALAKQVGFFLKEYLYPYAIFKVVKNIREKIYINLLNAEPSFFIKFPHGDLVSRATNDIEAFVQVVKLLGVNLIAQIFTVIAIIFVLIYRDWKLFLIFVIALPFLAIALNYFGEKRKKYSQMLQEGKGDYTQMLNQTITGIEVVKLFNKEIFLKIFKKLTKELFRREKKNVFYETFYLSSVEIIAYFATAGIIYYGGYRIIHGEITAGDFFSFLGGVLILVNSMQILQRGAVQLKALSPIVDRIQFLLNIPQEKDEGIEFKGLKEKILYENVRLKLGENEILKGINLEIKKGQKIGIVGLTGSGKSTIVKILPAIIKTYQGNVFLDEHELREYSISSLRKKIGMISQDVFIFNDTLRNNLLIAKPDATDEELIEALKKAKADFVFDKLEKGLDTPLGEKGSRLSGGERQRISIARIFLKKPDIVIIDEGTSALDVETEEFITEQLHKEFKNNTMIMITHRLKTLAIVDKIAVVENGKIVEEGTEKELVEKKGIFYKFFVLSGQEN